MSTTESFVAGKSMKPVGVPPAIILWNPKNAHNVGMALRTAACYGFKQLVFTGERVSLDPKRGERLPREERMKGYRDVELIQSDYPFDLFPKGTVPVAVEIRPEATNLPYFQHPENAVYVFGPEDASVPSVAMRHCHESLIIPTRYCLNLSVALGTILSHRQLQRFAAGLEDLPNPGDYEDRGIEELGTGDLHDALGAWDGNGR